MDLKVTALISENLNEIRRATLVYRVMYGESTKVTMESDGQCLFLQHQFQRLLYWTLLQVLVFAMTTKALIFYC